jgi:uncharacterized protein
MNISRRSLLQSGAVAAAAGLTAKSTLAATPKASTPKAENLAAIPGEMPLAPTLPPTTRRGDMLYRQMGSTGVEVSLIGLGGFHIGKQKEEAASIRIIQAAIDRGITFMDNCWDYNEGTSEVRMGKALKSGGRRDKVVLMTKLDGRSKAGAMRQLEESLARLRTDYVDLVQFHEIIRLEDPDRVFAPEGALEAVMLAKKQGKVRFVGFTGHKDPLVHRRMLEVAKAHNFHFDAVQMPINVMDAHFRSFEHQVLPILLQEKIAPLAMKTFGDHFILDHVTKSGTATPIQLLHYSMSRPVSVVITGIDSLKVLDQAMEATRTFKPMTKAQVAALLEKTRVAAMTGATEKFKTATKFDGTAQHPEWLA